MTPSAEGVERTLWQIGKTDNATLEFSSKWDFTRRGDPNFVIGTSTAPTDWSAFHPGSENVTYGSRPHPFRVSFVLRDKPVGIFYLTIDLLFKSVGIPQYVIEINGERGRFFLNPKLSDNIGDPETAWNILFSNERLRLSLPASFFRVGKNELILTCVDASRQAIVEGSQSANGLSGLYYDALQLSIDPEGKQDQEPTLTATPTLLYIRTDNGLREIVTLKVSSTKRLGAGSATLTFGEKHYSCNFSSQYVFGDAFCSVQVPEFRSSTPAQLSFRSSETRSQIDLTLTPARKWKLFLAPQMHLDMGYTAYRPNSYEVHARNIDEITSTLEKHKDYKFNPDGAFIFSDYWQHRSKQRRERVLTLMKEGRLTLPAQLFTINTGLASPEELFRLFYASADFARDHDVPITYANQTDVPAHVWALPSYLQAIGVRYLAISSNPFRGAIIPNGKLNAKSPFWWEGPDGARVLTSFSRQYSQFEQLFTTGNSVSAGLDSLPIFMQTYATREYIPDAALIYGTQSDNRPFLASELEFPEQWNRQFAFPKLKIATIDEYLGYVEQNFARSLPILRGDGGAWWEEMAASDAAQAASGRRTKERIIAAEEIASLASVTNPDITFPLALDERIWSNLLFYTEHTWGYARAWKHPVSNRAVVLRSDKEALTQAAALDVDDMVRRGLSQLTARLDLRRPTVVVFNSLSWARSDDVELDLPRGKGLIDAETGKALQLELVHRNIEEDYDRVRFHAENIPALGYRSYTIIDTTTAVAESDLPISDRIESRYYRVVINAQRGGIASIYDKTLGKELVDKNSPYVLDQYLYAGYGHDGDSLIKQRERWNSSLLQFSSALPRPNLNVSAAAHGKILSIRKRLFGTELTFMSSAAHTPAILTTVRLFDNEKRIEILNKITKDAVQAPEGVYFAFPFAPDAVKLRYESQNAWIDPETDQLPGANKEWFAAQHWISVSSPRASIGLVLNEAPLFTVGDIDRGRWPTALSSARNVVFSYVMNNYDGDDERPVQGGDFTFHYSITSAQSFQPEALSRFAGEENNPFETYEVTEADKLVWPAEPLKPASGGFIQIDSPAIILMTWKGAQDGNGWILRFYNTSASIADGHVTFPGLTFDAADWANATERDLSAAEVTDHRLSVSLKPHEIRTVRLTGLRLE